MVAAVNLELEQELLKLKLLVELDQMECSEFDEDLFKDELKELYNENVGNNVIPLFFS